MHLIAYKQFCTFENRQLEVLS